MINAALGDCARASFSGIPVCRLSCLMNRAAAIWRRGSLYPTSETRNEPSIISLPLPGRSRAGCGIKWYSRAKVVAGKLKEKISDRTIDVTQAKFFVIRVESRSVERTERLPILRLGNTGVN